MWLNLFNCALNYWHFYFCHFLEKSTAQAKLPQISYEIKLNIKPM